MVEWDFHEFLGPSFGLVDVHGNEIEIPGIDLMDLRQRFARKVWRVWVRIEAQGKKSRAWHRRDRQFHKACRRVTSGRGER